MNVDRLNPYLWRISARATTQPAVLEALKQRYEAINGAREYGDSLEFEATLARLNETKAKLESDRDGKALAEWQRQLKLLMREIDEARKHTSVANGVVPRWLFQTLVVAAYPFPPETVEEELKHAGLTVNRVQSALPSPLPDPETLDGKRAEIELALLLLDCDDLYGFCKVSRNGQTSRSMIEAAKERYAYWYERKEADRRSTLGMHVASLCLTHLATEELKQRYDALPVERLRARFYLRCKGGQLARDTYDELVASSGEARAKHYLDQFMREAQVTLIDVSPPSGGRPGSTRGTGGQAPATGTHQSGTGTGSQGSSTAPALAAFLVRMFRWLFSRFEDYTFSRLIGIAVFFCVVCVFYKGAFTWIIGLSGVYFSLLAFKTGWGFGEKSKAMLPMTVAAWLTASTLGFGDGSDLSPPDPPEQRGAEEQKPDSPFSAEVIPSRTASPREEPPPPPPLPPPVVDVPPSEHTKQIDNARAEDSTLNETAEPEIASPSASHGSRAKARSSSKRSGARDPDSTAVERRESASQSQGATGCSRYDADIWLEICQEQCDDAFCTESNAACRCAAGE